MEPTSPPPSAKPTSEPTSEPTSSPTKAPVTPLPTSLPTALPTPRPTSDGVGDDSGEGAGNSKEFTTPNIGKATDKAKGVIFTVTAKSRDVLITALGVVGAGKEVKKSDIEVYAHAGSYKDFPDAKGQRGRGKNRGRGKGGNRNVAHWDEHFEGKVELNQHEIVEVELDEEIIIPSGDTVTVYVVSKKRISYKESTSNEFDVYAENDDLAVRVGTTTRKEFKQTEKLADFAGQIVYQTGILA